MSDTNPVAERDKTPLPPRNAGMFIVEMRKGSIGSSGRLYETWLDGRQIVVSSHNPEFDTCRALQSEGLEGRIGFHHEGDPTLGIITTIAAGAKLAIDESSGSPRFRKWKPFKQE